MTGKSHSEETKKKISDNMKSKDTNTGAPIEVIRETDLTDLTKIKLKNGYINLSIPNPIKGKPAYTMREHVAIIEKRIDRKLHAGEMTHHWGAKDDNNPMLITLVESQKKHKVLDKAKVNLHKYLKERRGEANQWNRKTYKRLLKIKLASLWNRYWTILK